MNTEVRNAVKRIREHYDTATLFSSNRVFSNALGDMLGDDGKKLRMQLQLAMDAGVGRMYLDQGASPDAGFHQRVQNVMEESGLSPQAAAELTEVFDEAAGWASRPADMPAQSAFPMEERSSRETAYHPAETDYRPAAMAAPAPIAFSMKKALIVAFLPLVMVLLYIIGDRFTMDWVTNFISRMAPPRTFYQAISYLYWYRNLVPLVLPQLMAVLSVPAAWLLLRQKKDPAANCYLAGGCVGLGVCLLGLNVIGSLLPSQLAHTTFAMWTLGVFRLLSMRFKFLPLHTTVFLGISILSAIFGAILAQLLVQRKNSAR